MTTVGYLFARVSQAIPAEPFIHTGGDSYRYAQLWNQSLALAGWLLDNGLSKGDRVVLAGRNSAELIGGYLGTLLAGGVAVPISSSLVGGNGLPTKLQPRAVLYDRDQSAVAALWPAAVPMCLCDDEHPSAQHTSLHDLVRGCPAGLPEVAPDDEAFQWVVSSGHTLTHAALLEQIGRLARQVDLLPGDAVLIAAPLAQLPSFLCLLAHMALGGQVLLGMYHELHHHGADPVGIVATTSQLRTMLRSNHLLDALDPTECRYIVRIGTSSPPMDHELRSRFPEARVFAWEAESLSPFDGETLPSSPEPRPWNN